MKIKKISYAVSIGLALCLINTVSAQDDHWNGTITNTLWNNPNNWLFNGSTAEVPPSDATSPYGADNLFAGNVWLDPSPVDGDSVIEVPSGDVETPGVPLYGEENYNTIFGPEFGCTLNVYGDLSWDWTIAPYQPDPTPGLRSHINIYGNGYMHTTGASLNLGSGWWNVCEGCYVTMNLYDNANYSSLGGAGLWSGGHINIYDSATFLANGYVNLDNGQANNDGTTDFVLGGGTLMLPNGFSGTATNWIGRGILRVYGKGYDTNDLIINDNVASVIGTNDYTNTVVTAVPLGGSLQRVYFQPLLRSTVAVGTFQQATLVGDYPSVSGVLLSSEEPGLDPATFTHPVYSSSNPNVATIDTNGLVTAINPGIATLTATVGAFTSTNSVSITVTPVTATLIHRYSFTTDASDSIGGANGTLIGTAHVSGGQLVLDGSATNSYVQLPAGIVSGLDELTVETWVSCGNPINTNANIFAFGNTETLANNNDNPASATFGDGENYVNVQLNTSAGNAQANFGQGDPGNAGERDAVIPTPGLSGQTNVQIVAVYHPLAGYEAIYTNGVLGATISMWNNLIDPVANEGPTFTNINTGAPGGSILAYTLGADPANWIGQSLYTGDPYPITPIQPDLGFNGSIDEFRIYNGPLTAAQIAADYALGPNQLIGTSTNVSLSASLSGSNIIVSWPTNSALVTLQSTPMLGNGASWSTVSGTLGIVGGKYQITMPASSSAQFFRLSQ